MTAVAKIILINSEGKYLLMYRNAHPMFGNDPDIPGGLVEPGEEPLEGTIREVKEEAGITFDESKAELLYQGTDYSHHGRQYSLYYVQLNENPEVVMSWEHGAFEWLIRNDFLEKAKSANDTFMHMVHKEVIKAGA